MHKYRFKLHETRESFYDDGSKGFLVGFPNGRVYWAATQYLAHCAKEKKNKGSTRYYNALYLVRFFNYLIRFGVVGKTNTNMFFENKIYSVVSKDLTKYHTHLTERDGIDVASANNHLSAVVDYYWWLEKNKKTDVDYLCGWADLDNGIPVHRIQVGRGSPDNPDSFKNPFREKTSSRVSADYVPTRKQMDLLYELVSEQAYKSAPSKPEDMGYLYNVRNVLILDWMSQAGLRLNECRSLRETTIRVALRDAENEANALARELAELRGEEHVEAEIKRMVSVKIYSGAKNSKARMVQVSPELIERTIDYLDDERQQILLSGKCKDTGEVFITTANKKAGSSARMSDTGMADVVTFDLTGGNRSKAELRESNGRDMITPHTLRRYAITNYAVLLIKADKLKKRKHKEKVSDTDWNLMLNNVRTFAGHEEEDTTLQSYIDIAKVICDQDPEATRAEIEFQRQLVAHLETLMD